jgi:hypothetical protein
MAFNLPALLLLFLLFLFSVFKLGSDLKIKSENAARKQETTPFYPK